MFSLTILYISLILEYLCYCSSR